MAEVTQLGPGLTDRILHHLSSICGSDEVRTNLDFRLFDCGVLDSMKTVELIVAIEEDLGVYVSPAELDRPMWATPRKIIADVQRRMAKQ